MAKEKKRRIPLQQRPDVMNAPTLPGMGELPKTHEQKADEYSAKLMAEGFIGRHDIYLSNYVNSEIGIAMSHIKKHYIEYVLKGEWDEKKFSVVLEEIINKNFMLTNMSFLKMGTKYDKGEIFMTYNSSNSNSTVVEGMSDEQLMKELDDIFY